MGKSLKNRIRITSVQSFSHSLALPFRVGAELTCVISSAFGRGASCSSFLFQYFLRGGLIRTLTTVGGRLLSFLFVFSDAPFGSRDDRSLCCVVVRIVYWGELGFDQSSQGGNWGACSLCGIGLFLRSHWYCGAICFVGAFGVFVVAGVRLDCQLPP